MQLYRVYYACGFWGDEIAESIEAATAKGKDFAASNRLRVIFCKLLD